MAERLVGAHPLDRVIQAEPWGIGYFTPTWAAFRAAARGFDAGAVVNGSTPAAGVQRLNFDPDTGLLEAERLDVGDGRWLDLGGAPGTLVPARQVRP